MRRRDADVFNKEAGAEVSGCRHVDAHALFGRLKLTFIAEQDAMGHCCLQSCAQSYCRSGSLPARGHEAKLAT